MPRMLAPNVTSLEAPAPADLRKAWETTARVRFIRSRRALGLSQGGAAALIHASADSVERWEAGRVRVPAWALVALEDRLRARDELRAPEPIFDSRIANPLKEAA